MEIFTLLAANIFPLYILIAFGYIAGRWLDVNLHSMAIIAIYILAPLVNLGGMMQLKFDATVLLLPVIMFFTSGLIGTIYYKTAPLGWKDTTANLISLASVSGNTGYFGLPVILALFDVKYAAIYMIMNIGLTISELTTGYYFGARGHGDVKQAMMKVLKLPVIHAVWIGLLLNALGAELSPVMTRYWNYATGAWVFVGMMLIGVALGKQERLELDFRLMRWLFSARFIAWPLAGAAIIAADSIYFHLFEPTIYKMIAVFSAVPLAGNLVAYATNLNLHPERAAAAVLTSTFLALFTIPLALWVFSLYENMH